MKLVSVVLATYKPNITYLTEQLISLNNQDYSQIEIIIRDDSEDEGTYNQICDLAKNLLTNFPYTVKRNEKNLGSNETFQLLTREAEGIYIAYCDQDDIWSANKISTLVNLTVKTKAVMSYSDLSVIDDNGQLIAKSFRDVNKRVKHFKGENLFGYLLRRNMVTGCTMLINTQVAKQAVPFCHHYVHDHWLALYSSAIGKIAYCKTPLVQYRIHANNQIGAKMLHGVQTKHDYIYRKLFAEREKYIYLLRNYNFSKKQKIQIIKLIEWTRRRIVFLHSRGFNNLTLFFALVPQDYQLAFFELFIKVLPAKKAMRLIKKLQNNCRILSK